MAERSKAPDSRIIILAPRWVCGAWAFWSTNVGVGSNPTSDTFCFSFIMFLIFLICNKSTCNIFFESNETFTIYIIIYIIYIYNLYCNLYIYIIYI